MKKLLAEIFIVLFLAIGITLFFNRICNPYNEKADRVVRGLYSEEEIFEDLDVALIGGSHGCNGFNPHEIYLNYGLTAYNFSLSGEPIYINYYYLEEMFKTKKPDIVVLDVYYLGMANENFSGNDYIFDILRCFRYNKTRYDCITNTIDNLGDKWRAWLPIVQYHSRFCEITKQDIFRTPLVYNDWLLGSQYYLKRNAGEEVSFETWDNTRESGGINERNRTYLQKIIDLVKEHHSELLFVDLPHNHVDSNAPDKWVENEYAVMNEAKEIAKENGILFLQYDDEVLDEIGFVPEEDMYNKGHMNYWGSVKVSKYLGKFLTENYNLDTSVSYPEIWGSYMKIYKETVR